MRVYQTLTWPKSVVLALEFTIIFLVCIALGMLLLLFSFSFVISLFYLIFMLAVYFLFLVLHISHTVIDIKDQCRLKYGHKLHKKYNIFEFLLTHYHDCNGSLLETREWCRSNCTGKWDYSNGGYFFFSKKEDLMAFKLKWF